MKNPVKKDNLFNVKLPDNLRGFLDEEREKFFQETNVKISLGGIVSHLLFKLQESQPTSEKPIKAVKVKPATKPLESLQSKKDKPKPIKKTASMLVAGQELASSKRTTTTQAITLTESVRRIWCAYESGLSSDQIAERVRALYPSDKCSSSYVRKKMNDVRKKLGLKTNDEAFEHIKGKGLLDAQERTENA